MRTNILTMEKNNNEVAPEIERRLAECALLIEEEYKLIAPPGDLAGKTHDDILEKTIYSFYSSSAFAKRYFRNKKATFRNHIKRILNITSLQRQEENHFLLTRNATKLSRKNWWRDNAGYTDFELQKQILEGLVDPDSYY